MCDYGISFRGACSGDRIPIWIPSHHFPGRRTFSRKYDQTMDDVVPKGYGPAATNEKDVVELSYEKTGHAKATIEKLGTDLNYIFEQNGLSKNGTTYLRGAVFALNSIDLGNDEWREHTAASLREILHEWKSSGAISNAFCKALKKNGNNFPTSGTHATEYRRLEAFYGYFSEICHHRSTFILFRLRVLYGDGIKAGDDNTEMFLAVIKDYIQELVTLFRGYI